jgi:valyl-tRNA synthetase
MGHALTDTLQDLMTRWKRMQGYEALWIPGTDHAGIATQTVVERNLYVETGKKRKDMTREAFVQEVWKWKEKSEQHIVHQLKMLGASCDWSRLRFTMDAQNNRAVRTIFRKLFDAGLIYRGDYLVNWDPVSQTALSDDEVEHEERPSSLWTLRYGSLHVATTRPETLFGDVAVAVHPEDERYRSLVGTEVLLPLTNRMIPVVADPFVDRNFGTGVVKITPAHDFHDYEVAQRLGLPLRNILTPDGHLNEEAGPFARLSLEKARKEIVTALRASGYLEREEPHLLRIGVSYRSKAVIEPYLSKQWFVRMKDFKEPLLRAVRSKSVQLLPPHWQSTYERWIDNVRDWCISRQIWWGHRIPIWYDRTDPDRMLCYDGEGEPPEVARDPERWQQDRDVLDTWFSSALWPFSVLGWPDETKELKKFYPTSLLITGHDILFFWVARMILMGEYALGDVPFRAAFLHGLIYGKSYWRTEQGSVVYVSAEEKRRYDLGEPMPSGVSSKWEKMSKSKGNVIDPIEIIQEYGADALRMALCSSATQARQIDLDRRRFEEFKNFANKVWNGARFVFMNLEGLDAKNLAQGLDVQLLSLEDRWILSVLNRTIQEMCTYLADCAFDRAATLGYEFYWNEFCARYVELAKPILFGKRGSPAERENKQKILVIVLCSAIRLLHPITPFITEEIFSQLKEQWSGIVLDPLSDAFSRELVFALQAPALVVAPYPTVCDATMSSPEIEAEFGRMFQFVHVIRTIRAEMQLPPSEKTELFLLWANPEDSWSIVYALTPTSTIHFVDRTEDLPSFGSGALVGPIKLMIPIPQSMKIKEHQRLVKEREKLEKKRQAIQTQLNSEAFRQRAPAELVQSLEAALEQLEEQLSEVQQKLGE